MKPSDLNRGRGIKIVNDIKTFYTFLNEMTKDEV
jgi:hypothetical protein